MSPTATITSKRQLTIPSKIFNKMGFKKGDKVILEEENGKLTMKKASNLVKDLGGSVKIPSHLKAVDIDIALKKAKEKYFSKKLSR